MYRELDDSEILYMINDNDDNYEYLFKKYKPLLFTICKEYEQFGKSLGYELEDLMQFASIGFFNAIKSYREKKNVLFYTYMVSCVKNILRNELRNQLTNKKIVLNTAIPYDEPLPGISKAPIDFIPDKSSPNPITFLLEKMEELFYIDFLNSLPIEIAVSYEMKSQAFKDNEIAMYLDTNEKVIQKYIRRAKKAFHKAKLEFENL